MTYPIRTNICMILALCLLCLASSAQASMTVLLSDDFEGTLENWNTGFLKTTQQVHNATYSVRASAGVNPNAALTMANPIDATDADEIRVSFWIRQNYTDQGSDIFLRLYADGVLVKTTDLWVPTGLEGPQWTQKTFVYTRETNPGLFVGNFAAEIKANNLVYNGWFSTWPERVYVDQFSVTTFRILDTFADGTYASPDQQGQLTVDGNLRVAKLSGTLYAMGRQHGYFLATEIMNVFNKYCLWMMETQGLYYSIIEEAEQYVIWGNDDLEEMNGILDGMAQALPEEDRQVRIFEPVTFSRTFNMMDLKAMNLIGEWQGLGCSSFSIWGAGRNNGETLLARNVDYPADPGEYIKACSAVVSYTPVSGKKWVNVTIAGAICAISAMDENGLSCVMHDTNFLSQPNYVSILESNIGTWGVVSRGIALRNAFLSAGPDTVPSDIEAMLDDIPAFKGNNFLFAFSGINRADDDVAGIMEYDALTEDYHDDGRATLRMPSDNPYLPSNESIDQTLDYQNGLILTNHYLKRLEVIPTGSSTNRYQTIKNGLANATSDGHVDLDEAIGILGSVSGSYTLQSILFEPNLRKIHVYLADPQGAAYQSTRHSFDFDDLFLD